MNSQSYALWTNKEKQKTSPQNLTTTLGIIHTNIAAILVNVIYVHSLHVFHLITVSAGMYILYIVYLYAWGLCWSTCLSLHMYAWGLW